MNDLKYINLSLIWVDKYDKVNVEMRQYTNSTYGLNEWAKDQMEKNKITLSTVIDD